MKLEDVLIDYISTYPNGDLSYINYYINKATDNEVITFVNLIKSDMIILNTFPNINMFIDKIKIELITRATRNFHNTKLSIDAKPWIPNKTY